MPIDPKKVDWETPAIDPKKVEWEGEGVPAGRAEYKPMIPRAPEVAASLLPSIGKQLVGAYEAVMSPVETGRALLDVIHGGARNINEYVLPKPVFDFMNKLGGASPETVERVVNAANAFGGDYARAYGSWDRFVKTAEQDPARVMADLSILLGVTGKAGQISAAARRASPGPLTELAQTGARVMDPLALPLTGVNKLADVAAPGVTYALNMLSPTYRMLEPALEGRGEQYVSALLNQPQQIVPGSQRSAGEMIVAGGGAGTQFPALEQRLLSQFEPTRQAEVEAARAKAQKGSIETISGTPEMRQSAVEARTAATKPLYENAVKQIAETDETFAKLMQTPAMQDALSAATRMAGNRYETLMRGEIKPAETVKSKVLGPDGQPLEVEIPAQTAKLTGEALQDIKMAFDEAVKPRANETAPQAAARKSVAEVRAEYIDWLEKTAPDLMKARKTFAEKSGPINVMEAGEVIRRSLESPLSEGQTRAGVFANAVLNAPSTLKKATGEPRFERLSDVFETGDTQRILRVLEDLRTSKEYKDLAKAGRVEAQELTGAQLPTPKGFLNRVATLSNRILEAVEGRINRDAAIRIAEAAYDPQRMAKMIQEVMAMEKRSAAREASIRATTQKVTNAMRGKAPILNVLAIQQELQPRP